jgi:hypothetical protein
VEESVSLHRCEENGELREMVPSGIAVQLEPVINSDTLQALPNWIRELIGGNSGMAGMRASEAGFNQTIMEGKASLTGTLGLAGKSNPNLSRGDTLYDYDLPPIFVPPPLASKLT